MKLRFDKRHLHAGFIAFLVIAASIWFYYLIFYGERFSALLDAFFKVIAPIIYGIVFAYLMTPLLNGIEAHLLMPILNRNEKSVSDKQKNHIRIYSILLTIMVVALAVYGFFSILIPNVIQSIGNISYQFPYYVRNFLNWSSKILEDNPDIEKMIVGAFDTYSEEFTGFLNNRVMPQMETLIKHVSLSLISAVKVLWNFVIGVVISIYVLYSKEIFAGQAKKIVYAVMNAETANQFIKDVRFASKTFIGFIGGKIVDSIIIGIICFVGNSILRIPYALLISVIVGVTNIIPFFGPYLGAIPSAMLVLMVSPVKCLYFILFVLVLQQVDGNFIGPKILGQSIGLSGFWILFSITVFGGIMGVTGMMIGVPFFAVLYAFVRRMTNRMLQKKGLPLETERYLNVDYVSDNNEFVPIVTDEKVPIFKRKKEDADEESGRSDELLEEKQRL